MESHLNRQFTLAELEPGWPEDFATRRVKSSPRMHGSMMMALRRVSRNPENSRIYTHGDPVHLIDWKAYARTDELIMREHRDEASARVCIIIDPNETLHWPDPIAVKEHGGVSEMPTKIEIAIRVALYLAHAHLTMGDVCTIGMLDKAGDITRSWTPRSPADVLGMFRMCVQSGFMEALESLMLITNWSSRVCDTTWWISDFLKDEHFPKYWIEARGLSVIHIFSGIETKSNWMDHATSYRDESRGRKIYLGELLKQGSQWQEEIARWQGKVKRAAKKSGGVYIAVDDQTNVGDFFHWLLTEAVV